MTRETGETARHPIGVVAERTGLSQDVLRVWERRYGVVKPARDTGGQRLYTDADVARLRLLRRATEAGRSIGQVSGLAAEELARLVAEDATFRVAPEVAPEREVGGAFDFAAAESRYRALDAAGLEVLLSRWLLVEGLPRFVEGVAVPMLQRIGVAWHEGRLGVAAEHLATAVLERVIARGMEALVRGADAPAVVVATPAGERHEIGALLAAAVAAVEGWRVVWLGADLPAEEIARAARESKAEVVGVSVVLVADRERVVGELAALRSRLPAGVAVLAGGAGATTLGPELRGLGIEVLSLSELRGWLGARKA